MADIKPIVITDNDTQEQYVLRFTRSTVRKLEQSGFELNDIERHPMTRIPELFWGAFLAERPYIQRKVTDDILYNKLGGLSNAMMERLGQLYSEPFNTLVIGEDEPANPTTKMTVEL